MFQFDQSALPQLTTRQALIVVDFQNDFIGAEDGSLSVKEPLGFVDRAIELATAFRAKGDVVWVQSRFDKVRPVDIEQIIVSDDAPDPCLIPPQKARKGVIQPADDPFSGPPDPEAFLSQNEPTCVRPSHHGCEMPPTVKEAVKKGDLVLNKSHYSAFQQSPLLRMLRGKMVMEVFICGSLTNVGVYATALEAAGHGMAITVVEDCSGYRHESRQRSAIKNLIELTGCEIASLREILETLDPGRAQSAALAERPRTPSLHSPPSSGSDTGTNNAARLSVTPDLVRPLDSLRIASASPRVSAVGDEANLSSESKDMLSDKSQSVKRAGPKEANGVVNPPKLSGLPEMAATTEPTETIANTHDPHANQSQSQPDQPDQPASPTTKRPTKPPSDNPLLPVSPPTDASSTRKEDMDDDLEFSSEIELLNQNGLCEGDTDVILNVLPELLAEKAFKALQQEVRWRRMSHQGGEVPRLVAVQGEVAKDGSMPVYRHPADESPPLLPFSPTVSAIKSEVEKHLGHPVNHALVQFYRDGNDYISEHSDKTLDIVAGSYIANVSLGAERTMVLRTKRLDKDPSRTEPLPSDLKRKVQRARLPHNSMCRMGLQTNMKWMHAIRQDKRADRDKSPAELAYSGGRISLTFRHIGTFLRSDEAMIWGQGATGKTHDTACPVINGQSPEAVKMLQAFSAENHSSTFDWEVQYGSGFDVLHISNSPRFFASGNTIINMRIHLQLIECGINYAKGSIVTAAHSEGNAPEEVAIKFVDNDACKSVVHGDLAIMLYLDSCYGRQNKTSLDASRCAQAEAATRFTRFQKGLSLLPVWQRIKKGKNENAGEFAKALREELATWDDYAAEASDDTKRRFIAGEELCIADYAVWPVLHAIWEEVGAEAFDGLVSLQEYYQMVAALDSVKKILAKPRVPPGQSE